MGRTLLILFSLLLFTAAVSAYDFDYSCSKIFEDYYFGGEYFYFTCTIIPKSPTDAKLADDREYNVVTQLDSSAISAVVEYRDGKKELFPTPQDDYRSDESGTALTFFVPESDDGVSKIVLTVSGYVPVVSSRLGNLTVLKAEAGDVLIHLQATVVNKQKFYSDIKDFEDSQCADQKKLKEVKLLYNDGKYREAEELIKDVENAVEACYMRSRMETYQPKIDNLKALVAEINRDLILIQYRLETEKGKIENYEEVRAKFEELYPIVTEVNEDINEVEKLVSDGKFTAADTKIAEIETDLSSLKLEVDKLKNSVREKSIINDLTTIAVAGGGIAVAAIAVAVIMVSRRRRDKW